MPKVTESHRIARRNEILEAAQRVFSRGGYRASSVAEIIKESGLSAGAIYSYFESKDELFHAVVDRTFSARTSKISQARESAPRSPGELVRSVVEDMGEGMFTIAPQVWAEAAVEPEARTAVATVFTQLGALFRGELTEWAKAHPTRVGDDPDAWVERQIPVLVAVVPGFIVQKMAMPDFDVPAFLDALVRTLDP